MNFKNFETNKKNTLNKKDRSKKGSLDKPIKELIDEINKLKNYYTTSSCSGRTLILEPSDKKNKVKWLYVTHNKAKYKEIKKALKTAKNAWLKKESAIFHIACNTREAAEQMLNTARKAGFKRAGIISPNKNIIEIIGTDQLAVPLTKKNKTIVSDEYIKHIIRTANTMQTKNHERLIKLKNYIKDIKS